MAALATEMRSRIAELSDSAFAAFCEDIGGMFGVEMRCERRESHTTTAGRLRERFDRLAAVHLVKADGALDGTFHLVFDQGGLFVPAGVVVMLPEPSILENVERGTMERATNLQDAVREVGNLLVGSWDRVFRAECPEHGHFVKTGTFLGKPWNKPEQVELQADAEVLVVLYEMSLDSYPSFTCAAVFPRAVLGGLAPTAPQAEPASQPRVAAPGPERPAVPEPRPSAAPRAASPQAGPGDDAPLVPQTLEEHSWIIPPTGKRRRIEAEMLPSELAAVQSADPGGVDLAFLNRARVRSQPNGAMDRLLSLPVAEIMEKDVVWASPEETVQDVIVRMQQHDTGYVLVGANRKLEGLVSNSNIQGAVSLYLRPVFAKWRTAHDEATLRVKARWIMSRPVRTVRLETTVASAVESMCRTGGRCLPVVDAKGAVQGIVTAFDVLLRILESDGNIAWKGRPPQAPTLMI